MKKKFIALLITTIVLSQNSLLNSEVFALDNVNTDTISENSEIVNIPDINLKHALNEALYQSADSNITKKQLNSLNKLRLHNKNIENLDGIQYCENLSDLDISYNKITDISSLSSLTKLNNLNLESNSVIDINPLKNLKSLKRLNLRFNKVSDISSLSNLSLLENLDLSYNNIRDLSILEKNINLVSLNLMGNENLENINSIGKLINLKELFLGSTNVSDIAFCKNIKSLEKLNLFNTKISSISDLSGLTSLKDLVISWTNLDSIEPLSKLINLERLIASKVRVSNGEFDVNYLKNLTKLRELDLSQNNISDINILKDMVNLESLNLQINNINDISVLALFKNLKFLDLDYNDVSDVNSLKDLRKLGVLDLSYNKISDISCLKNLTNIYSFSAYKQFISLPEKTIYSGGDLIVNNSIIDINGNIISPSSIDNSGIYNEKDNTVIWNNVNSYLYQYEFNENNFSGTVSQDVNLLENTAPVIKAEDKTIVVGEEFNPLAGVTAEDKEDGDITKDIKVIKNDVNVDKPGTYEVTYEVTDSQGAKSTKTIKVTVNPKMEVINTAPVIKAEDKTIVVGEEFNPLAGVTAEDKEDGDITKDIKVIKNDVNVDKSGTYEVTYEVTDSQGAKSTKTIKVTVNPKMEVINTAPVIKAEDKTIVVGEEFNPLAGVTAEDKEDGDITKDIKVIKNDVNVDKPGTYEVTYEVTDSQGVKTTKTITININDNNIGNLPNTGDPVTLPYIGGMLIAIGGLLKLKKKK
ncbi:DUF5011 domain-containing protein [Clostridium perfringens]|uniref:immunoglobulin-like domain-containing protein n=1 Tax=Clostridium perfringens TaxID=1502 RepID=UPI002247D193|nr:immunoglobulin-like domain-containing protein [Clostridium perfringens]MCX0357231.1 DUF5011 domain-containing protein [Clostridium perfringens]